MSRPYRQQSRLKEAARMAGIITARDISDAADSKPLGKFGSALIRRPVRDGRAMAECFYCADEPEPGWIETDNNGPIVPCPICSPTGRLKAGPIARRGNQEAEHDR